MSTRAGSGSVSLGISDQAPPAMPWRRAAGRLARWVATTVASAGVVLAFVALARASSRPGAGALRNGPLRADHVISHRPADDCNYVGAPPAQPGDVWMDAIPSGFLLTFTADGFWLPMCVNSFSDASASVACRMLGFQGASTHFNSQLHNASAHGLAPGVMCTGSETTLAECNSDPDFEKSWSECRRYPEEMAVKLTCYGDIAARRENHYELAKRFTAELKTAVRRCGSSQVLTDLMEEIGADGDALSLPRVGSGGGGGTAGSSDSALGKILGPILGAVGGIGIAAGTAAGTRAHGQNGADAAQLRTPLVASADRGQATPLPFGYEATARQAEAGGGTACSCSLVADLRELANLHGDGLLTGDEYSVAKSRLLAARVL
ncbi:hypothetical protein KFE25_007493 [Diacronema lutheri]|uniref:SRCR domain-containing protein n=1 Tax=Diacronema lutheri TaxID=2081491 RepID=A0A8J5XW07_DIALT|nr:hypothetical protein KFE25_007493 [Diacronema lutheri]